MIMMARFATVGPDGIPNVVPACYVHRSDAFWMLTDYRTRKYRNLQRNDKVAALVDVGNASNRGILVQDELRPSKEGRSSVRFMTFFTGNSIGFVKCLGRKAQHPLSGLNKDGR
jgi:hypothetical protein